MHDNRTPHVGTCTTLTRSLTHSLTLKHTLTLTHTCVRSLVPLLTQLFAYSLTHSLSKHSLARSLTDALTNSLNHPLHHSLNSGGLKNSLTHSLIVSVAWTPHEADNNHRAHVKSSKKFQPGLRLSFSPILELSTRTRRNSDGQHRLKHHRNLILYHRAQKNVCSLSLG